MDEGNIKINELQTELETARRRIAELTRLLEERRSAETAFRQCKEQLKENEEKFRLISEQSFLGIAIIQDGMPIYFNKAAIDIGEYPFEELAQWSLEQFMAAIHPDDRAFVGEQAKRKLSGDAQVIPSYSFRVITKTGKTKWLEIYSKTVCFQGKNADLVTLIDVTDRRKSQEAQRRLATAVEQIAEAIAITDKEGNIQYVNPAFERISGYCRNGIAGKKLSPLGCSDYNKAFRKQLWDTLARGDVWNGRLTSRKKDGSVYFEETTIAPVRDNCGEIANFVAVKRDVTSEVLLEKQLFHAQKMEAVGTLAGGIAHDFNNLLTVVLGYADYLLMDKSLGEPVRVDLRKISESAKKGAELVRSLLTFSRKVEPRLTPMDLNQQVDQVKNLLFRTLPKMITIAVSLEQELTATTYADPAQIQQVLMNLAVNARDSMPNGGKLTMQTTGVVLDDEFCRSHLGAKHGRYVMVSVSDTGRGIRKEVLDHIFEPFYTTKGMGRGTGLGLAVTYGIVKQHGGYIECESTVGEGSTFRVYLPALDEDAAQVGACQRPAIQIGTETVLLVDDEDLIRDLARTILVRAGYEVITATNGREALELYKTEANRVSLIILDLIMPEMGGAECLDELLRIDPGAKVLIASGYSADNPTSAELELSAKGFVWKPYNVKQFLDAVRHALDGE